MTRPKKEETLAKTKDVHLRMNETEYDLLAERAKANSMTVSDFIRNALNTQNVIIKYEITADVKEIKKEYKILITITSVLIMLSTVFIKQHVIVDVLGAFIIVPMYYIIRKKKINLEESGIYAKIFRQKKRTK